MLAKPWPTCHTCKIKTVYTVVNIVLLFYVLANPDPLRGVQPGPVTNLTITLNPNEPSVTLNWDPPTNIVNTWDVTSYDVRFKPSNRQHYDHKMVNGAVTSVHLTLDDGLEPLTRCVFEVRARNFDHTGEFTPVAASVGMNCSYITLLCMHLVY